MSTTNTGGPAFPCPQDNKSRIYVDLTPGGFIEASDFRHKITGGGF